MLPEYLDCTPRPLQTSSLPEPQQHLSYFYNEEVVLEGEAEPKELQDARNMRQFNITPGYFQTARIPLLRGRDFTPADNKDAPRVAIIDEEAARAWFPNQDPIGRQLRLLDKPGEPPKWATIIGIVKPVVYERLTKRRPLPAAYFPQSQTSTASCPSWSGRKQIRPSSRTSRATRCCP